jgi:hypothetical protein
MGRSACPGARPAIQGRVVGSSRADDAMGIPNRPMSRYDRRSILTSAVVTQRHLRGVRIPRGGIPGLISSGRPGPKS